MFLLGGGVGALLAKDRGLVIGAILPPGRFVTHDHWPAALDACRAALTPAA